MFRVPKVMLNESFSYQEYLGQDRYSEASYASPVNVNHVRIDRTSNYTAGVGGETLLWTAVIFVYPTASKGVPSDFKEKSKVIFDGKDHYINSVVENKHPYTGETFSYELEVV